MPLLGAAEREYAGRLVRFPNCMVSRVVPAAAENPLALVAEDYNEWTVDAAAWVGPPLDLPAMELVPDQETRLARKFFMHNGAHAVCGYWGFHRGHTYIHQAIADALVREHVLAVIEELAPVVARRYDLDLESVRQYGLELGARGAVAELQDPILRVVRDPLRKLARAERLTAPAELALGYGLPLQELLGAMAAALHYHHPGDRQSLAMREQLLSEGPLQAIPAILDLPADHPLVGLAVTAYEGWVAPAPAR
jgi:mannitol-1-phosphate 5-dehydrogenase